MTDQSINHSINHRSNHQTNIPLINQFNHLGEHEEVSESADDESRGNARHDEANEVGPARGALLLEGGDGGDEAPDNKDIHSWIYFIWLTECSKTEIDAIHLQIAD
jgi:hypothetical protein